MMNKKKSIKPTLIGTSGDTLREAFGKALTEIAKMHFPGKRCPKDRCFADHPDQESLQEDVQRQEHVALDAQQCETQRPTDGSCDLRYHERCGVY